MARGRTPIAQTIDLTGPFFKGDPAKTFLRNVRDLMAAVAEEGEADVRAQLEQGQGTRAPISAGVQPARVSGHVRGRAVSLKGRKWAYTAVVSVNNQGLTKRQGIALMAAAASLEQRTHAFRRTATRLRKAIKTIDLTKDLN